MVMDITNLNFSIYGAKAHYLNNPGTEGKKGTDKTDKNGKPTEIEDRRKKLEEEVKKIEQSGAEKHSLAEKYHKIAALLEKEAEASSSDNEKLQRLQQAYQYYFKSAQVSASLAFAHTTLDPHAKINFKDAQKAHGKILELKDKVNGLFESVDKKIAENKDQENKARRASWIAQLKEQFSKTKEQVELLEKSLGYKLVGVDKKEHTYDDTLLPITRKAYKIVHYWQEASKESTARAQRYHYLKQIFEILNSVTDPEEAKKMFAIKFGQKEFGEVLFSEGGRLFAKVIFQVLFDKGEYKDDDSTTGEDSTPRTHENSFTYLKGLFELIRLQSQYAHIQPDAIALFKANLCKYVDTMVTSHNKVAADSVREGKKSKFTPKDVESYLKDLDEMKALMGKVGGYRDESLDLLRSAMQGSDSAKKKEYALAIIRLTGVKGVREVKKNGIYTEIIDKKGKYRHFTAVGKAIDTYKRLLRILTSSGGGGGGSSSPI